MIRLTVLYNLPPGSDEAAFLRWRLGEHQEENASQEGVIRTDFARVADRWPGDEKPPYRFMTTADWPDRERISDALFLISEILVESKTP